MLKRVFKNYSITGVYHGLQYNNNWNQRVYSYTITAVNKDTNKKTRFNYYEGIGNKAGEADVLNAFYCFLGDCISYIDCKDFFDFCDNFGYSYTRDAKNIYNACKNAYLKYNRFTSEDLIDLYNEVSDLINA